jgi:hypothetical protein
MKESEHEAKTLDRIGVQFDDLIQRVIMLQGTGAAPGLSLEIFLPGLIEFRISTSVCKFLR